MSKECSIVRDLLPLYAEDMVSPETGEFVKEHLEGCEECRGEYEKIKLPQVRDESSRTGSDKEAVHGELNSTVRAEVAPLVNLKHKLWKQKVRAVLCTGVFLVALFVSAFAVLSIPVYFPYEEDLFTVKENSDGGITVVFDERVTDYLCTANAYGDGEEGFPEVEMSNYQIEAWTSLWSRWFAKGGTQSLTIPKGTKEISVYYTSNDGHEDVCVYGEPVTSGGVITLPRHVLNYYFVLAVMCTVVLFVLWLFAKCKGKKRNVVETLLFYPISYCIAHVIIAGFRTSTYTSGRDFVFIVFVSILIYGGVLLGRSIYREKKEIKELTEK